MPIRVALMPLLHAIVKSEAIKEKETVWYNSCRDFISEREMNTTNQAPTTNKDQQQLQAILQILKPSVRKDIRKKLRLFHKAGITTQTTHSDYLSLQDDIPIVWRHEKRTIETSCETNASVVEEFLKRFLVLFLVPHAYLDRYYDPVGRQCGVYLFVACTDVLSSFTYFCDIPNQGIWQYNHIRALTRGVLGYPKIKYVNYHVHQSFAKRLAGAQGVDYTDTEQLQNLYPFQFFREPPQEVIKVQLDLESLILEKKTQ